MRFEGSACRWHWLKPLPLAHRRMIITLVEYFDSKYPPVHKPWEHEA